VFLFIVTSVGSIGLETKEVVSPTIDSVNSQTNHTWPMYGLNTRHTSQSPYTTMGNGGGIKWSYATEWLLENGPAIDRNGTIYVLDWRYLYSIYSNGTLKWRYYHGDTTGSSPAIGDDGTIYFGLDNSLLYAINPNGTLKWTFTANDNIKSSPIIGPDGIVYFSTFDRNGKFYAVNPNGTEKWHYDADFFCQKPPAIADDGTIYFNSHVYLYSFNPNGTLNWNLKIGDENFVFLGGPAIGDDGTIYIPRCPGPLYAINPNGTVKWTCGIKAGSTSTPAIGYDGTIYIGYNGFHAVNPNGTKKWVYYPDGDQWHEIDSRTYAISSDGTIYMGTQKDSQNCYIIAMNPDGTEKWRTKVSNERVLSPPVIGVDGTVYVGAYNNNAVGALVALHGTNFRYPVIVRPEVGRLYFIDFGLRITPGRGARCIGRITIEATHPYPDNVSCMEFWVDGIKQSEVTEPPYEWTWKKRQKLSGFRSPHKINVIAVNHTGVKRSASMDVWRIF